MECLTADQLEADWERALDSASEAVSFCADAKLLTRAYAEREVAIIRAERKWLERVSPSLRRLFPPARSALTQQP
jgi:hypothetical protein